MESAYRRCRNLRRLPVQAWVRQGLDPLLLSLPSRDRSPCQVRSPDGNISSPGLAVMFAGSIIMLGGDHTFAYADGVKFVMTNSAIKNFFLPAAPSKYQPALLWTSGMGRGQLSSPTFKVSWSGSDATSECLLSYLAINDRAQRYRRRCLRKK